MSLFKKRWGLSRKRTGTRLYQQITLLVLLIVTIPLGGLSIWLYDINDSALRKSIAESQEQVLSSTLTATRQEVLLRQEQSHTIGEFYKTLHTGRTPWFSKSRFTQLVQLDSSLLFTGLCHTKEQRLMQWASRKTPPPHVLDDLSTWACSAPEALPKDAPIPRYTLRLPWAKNSLEPTWLSTRTEISSSYNLVQVRQVQSLHTLLKDLLHVQRAGVWLVSPDLASYHIREKSNDLNFQQSPPPNEVIDAIQGEQNKRLAVEKEQQEKNNAVGELPSLISQNIMAQMPNFIPWITTKQNDEEYILTELSPLNWWLVVSPDRHENTHIIKKARLQTFLLIGLSLLMSLLIGMGYIFGIVRNFKQLIKGVRLMGEGNYGRQIRLISNWVTPFEITYLTTEVNRMSRQLKKQMETIRRANAELAKLDELRSNLIDTVSHELRTPLMNIQGYTNRLIRHKDKLSPDMRESALNTIRQQCKRLNRLVEDLLVIPDLENNQLRVYCEDQAIGHLWDDLRPLLSERVQSRLVVEWEHEDALTRQCIHVDTDRLHQVLINLLENAAKYSRNEDDAITLSFTQNGESLSMSISNPSEPIPPEAMEKLFEKFHRQDDSLTRQTRGSGLGLFIAKALTEAMEGKLTITFKESAFLATLTFQITT
jgi:signal transduction histidine kinase